MRIITWEAKNQQLGFGGACGATITCGLHCRKQLWLKRDSRRSNAKKGPLGRCNPGSGFRVGGLGASRNQNLCKRQEAHKGACQRFCILNPEALNLQSLNPKSSRPSIQGPGPGPFDCSTSMKPSTRSQSGPRV